MVVAPCGGGCALWRSVCRDRNGHQPFRTIMCSYSGQQCHAKHASSISYKRHQSIWRSG